MILKPVIDKYAFWTKKIQILIQNGIKIEIVSRNVKGSMYRKICRVIKFKMRKDSSNVLNRELL